MRAAVLETGATELVLRDDIAIEDPRPDEVMVRVHQCGICHSDLSMLQVGGGGRTPLVLGHEAAGVIEAVGSGVTDLHVGQKALISPLAPCGSCYWCVRNQPTLCPDAQAFTSGLRPDGTSPLSSGDTCVHRGLGVGGFGELTVVSARAVAPLGDDIPLEVACVIGCAMQTGVGAVVNTARVEPGATVLVTGLGGVGIAVVQGARLAGAGRIIASDPVAARRDAARHFGATEVVDPTTDDVVAKVLADTGGIGVDYAFEAAGVASLVTTCLGAIRLGGTAVVVGVDITLATVEVMPVLLATHGKRLMGTLLGDCHPRRDIPILVESWRSGRLDLESMITHRLGLDDINEGFGLVRDAQGIRTVVSVAS